MAIIIKLSITPNECIIGFSVLRKFPTIIKPNEYNNPDM